MVHSGFNFIAIPFMCKITYYILFSGPGWSVETASDLQTRRNDTVLSGEVGFMTNEKNSAMEIEVQKNIPELTEEYGESDRNVETFRVGVGDQEERCSKDDEFKGVEIGKHVVESLKPELMKVEEPKKVSDLVPEDDVICRVLADSAMKNAIEVGTDELKEDFKYACPLCEFWSTCEHHAQSHVTAVHNIEVVFTKRILKTPMKRYRCLYCHGNRNLKHLISECGIARDMGLYELRRQEVLKQIISTIELALKRHKIYVSVREFVPTLSRSGVLRASADWIIIRGSSHSLENMFPGLENFVWTDLILFSDQEKQVLLFELIVDFEIKLMGRHHEKTLKFRGLLNRLKSLGFDTKFYAVEVGARGLISQNLHSFFVDIGLQRGKSSIIHSQLQDVCKTAIKMTKKYFIHQNGPANNP